MSHTEPLFEVRNLKKHYPIKRGVLKEEVGRVRAVDGIDFELYPGETFGIVGESGCGKSTAATSMLRIEEPTDGEVRFDGEDILEYDDEMLRRFRRNAQMIFQDPDSSFNPRMNIGDAVGEPLVVQGMLDKEQRESIITDLLQRVGLSANDMKRYPHEFSGGQKQRIALARALSVNPKLIVADEPVSALDVSVQSEVLQLIQEFQERLDIAVLVISHNLAVVREICDRVAVMYLGEFVEVGPTEEIFVNPQHPYTRALLSAIPTPDPEDRGLGVRLTGTVPDPGNPPEGCRFHTRCPEVILPDGVKLPQQSWRRLLFLRKQIENQAIDVESIVDIGVIKDDEKYGHVDDPGPDDVERDDLKRWIREEYEVPVQLEDSLAEETLDAALDHFIAGDQTEARETLAENLTTICERETPVPKDVGEQYATCHLIYESDGSSVLQGSHQTAPGK